LKEATGKFAQKGLLNNCNIFPVDPHVGNREPYEKNKGVFKKARPARPQPLGRAEYTREYVSTAKGDLPARLRVEALQREDAKPLRRRQGTPLACLPSLLRRSSFGYEGWELLRRPSDPFGQTQGMIFNTP
jgi:hypothetical protein